MHILTTSKQATLFVIPMVEGWPQKISVGSGTIKLFFPLNMYISPQHWHPYQHLLLHAHGFQYGAFWNGNDAGLQCTVCVDITCSGFGGDNYTMGCLMFMNLCMCMCTKKNPSLETSCTRHITKSNRHRGKLFYRRCYWLEDTEKSESWNELHNMCRVKGMCVCMEAMQCSVVGVTADSVRGIYRPAHKLVKLLFKLSKHLLETAEVPPGVQVPPEVYLLCSSVKNVM